MNNGFYPQMQNSNLFIPNFINQNMGMYDNNGQFNNFDPSLANTSNGNMNNFVDGSFFYPNYGNYQIIGSNMPMNEMNEQMSVGFMPMVNPMMMQNNYNVNGMSVMMGNMNIANAGTGNEKINNDNDPIENKDQNIEKVDNDTMNDTNQNEKNQNEKNNEKNQNG